MSDSTKAETIFHEARQLSGDKRAGYLASACGDDTALRARVEALLIADEQAGSFLADSSAATLGDEAPTTGGLAADPLMERPGSMIGAYKLLELIGEGGFGSVFMAEQSQPVRRRVALKVIKLGMDTKQVVARFEQERQALAIMDHPNIAKVFDAGSTESGRPYFVMELCRGEPITDYCDRHGLNVQQRLEMFAQVCAAVQHAHSKGIIHRDIKPSNVLVSTQDDRWHVKVIDFGIAKATSSKLTEKTLFTAFSQMVGTPQYMSPEQAEGSFDIDTRTDVYALGVLLYELLTGVTPFDATSLRGAAYREIERIIREVEPPPPSARLSLNTETLASVAASRRTEPRKLSLIVRGELDWIVMKALEKDRQRRYETAASLATDISRYLSGEAVTAAPPSRWYRARKLVRRNRGLFTAACAVAAALLIGVIAFAWQATIARRQRDRAIIAESQATRRATELKQVSEFQAKMLSQIDATEAGARLMASIRAKFAAVLDKGKVPEAERATRFEAFTRELANVNGTDVAVEMVERTFLKPAITAVDAQFREQPAVDASLRHTVAGIYQTLGLSAQAEALESAALATRRRVLGDSDPDTLASINDLGLMVDSQGKFTESERLLREALDGRRHVLGDSDRATVVSMGNLGNTYRAQGKFADAEPLLKDALQRARRVLGDDDRDTLVAINSLGYLFVVQGKLADAEPLWREAYERGRRVMGEDDPDLLVWINNLGGLLGVQGRYKEAEAYFREVLDKTRRLRGEEHPMTIRAMSAIANNLNRQGRFSEAEPICREVLEKCRRLLGEQNPETLDAISGMAHVLSLQRRFGEAEPFVRESLAMSRRALGDDHPDTIVAQSRLASWLKEQGKFDESEQLFRDAVARAIRVLGAEHQDTLIVSNNFAGLLIMSGRYDEAAPIAQQTLQGRRHLSGDRHPETLIALSTFAKVLQLQGKVTESEPLFRDALEKFRSELGNDHPNTISAINNLADAIAEQRKFAEAEPLYREVIEGWSRTRGPDFPSIPRARVSLGEVLTALQKFTEAEKELLEANRAISSAASVPIERRRQCIDGLVKLYDAWDKAEPGKGHDAQATQWKGLASTMPTK